MTANESETEDWQHRDREIADLENRLESETRRANAAEAELREVAGELEKAKGLHEACHIELKNLRANVKSLDMEEPLALQKRLAEATALLELARDAIDEACYPVWWERWRAFLSATPSPPAEPAPSLVEQERSVLELARSWYEDYDLCEVTGMSASARRLWLALDALDTAADLLRAAREAGGR